MRRDCVRRQSISLSRTRVQQDCEEICRTSISLSICRGNWLGVAVVVVGSDDDDDDDGDDDGDKGKRELKRAGERGRGSGMD